MWFLKLAEAIYPWAIMSSWLASVICVWIFNPMLFFRKFRQWGAFGLVYASYVFGFSCWIFSFIVTYKTLGGFWLIIGLFFLAVGVVPLALIGTVNYGLWSTVGDLAFAIALFFIPRLLGAYFVYRHEKEQFGT
jgi:hypothetical protein